MEAGVNQQPCRAFPRRGEGQRCGRGDRNRAVAGLNGQGSVVAQAVGEVLDIVFAGGFGEHGGEFRTADTRQERVFRQDFADSVRGGPQHQIAHEPAVAFVDAPELVDVQVNHRDLVARVFGLQALQGRDERGIRVCAGQRVRLGFRA